METKTCINCKHSSSANKKDMFRKCIRIGNYTDIEMRYGGRCAGPREGVPKMNLWEPINPAPPQRTIWMRIKEAMHPTTGKEE